MKKKNNKGFMLAETLIVTTFVAGILIFLFIQFTNLSNSYNTYYNYNTTEGLYALEDIKNYIELDSAAYEFINNNISTNNYVDLTDCSVFEDSAYCLKLFEIENIKSIYVIPNYLSSNEVNIDNELIKKFIDKIKNEGEQPYKLIAQFNDDSLAALRVGKSSYIITYQNMDSSGLPSTIEKGQPLNINLNYKRLLYIEGVKINGVSTNEYTYTNGVLTLSNVNGNVEVIGPYTEKVTNANGILTVSNPKAPIIVNLKIYGNSVQNGTPTSNSPVQVDGTGEKENILIGETDQIIPSEYQQVDYIRSTGTQYIDTGVIANQNTGFDIKFYIYDKIDGTNYGTIFGARQAFHNMEFTLSTYGTASSGGTFKWSSNEINVDITPGEISEIGLRNKIYTSANGTTSNLSSSENFTTPSNVTLFALNERNDIKSYGNIKLYYFRMYDGDTLIRNFVPCYRKSDNVVGLYDLVTNTFYTNQGSGTFITNIDDGDYGRYRIPLKITGKNLFDEESILMAISGATYENGYYQFTSANARSKYGTVNDSQIPIYDFKENTQYTFSIYGHTGESGVNKNLRVYFSYTDGTSDNANFNFDEDDKLVYASAQGKTVNKITLSYNQNTTIYISYIQLEEGSTATEYEPYSSTTYNIYLDEPLRKAGKVADYIDIANKKIVRNVKELDLGSLIWSTDRNYYRATVPGIKTGSGGFLGNQINEAGYTTVKAFGGDLGNTNTLKLFNRYACIRDDDYGTPDDFKSAMVGIKFYGERTTPIEEPIDIPDIELNDTSTNIVVGTTIKPTIELEYYK